MDLKSIIKEQRQELEKIERDEKIILREKTKEAESFLKYPNILIITGVRRCGKSIFSYLLEKEKASAYINFDDERLSEIKTEDLDKILQAFYELYGDIEYIILDEIQNVPKWELFATRLRRSKKIIITGSNSKLLGSELATHLTGRHLDIQLFPFSFREFLNLKGFKLEKTYTTKEKSNLLNYLKDYLETGGFPEAYKFGKSMVRKIYDDIVMRDILLRHKIKKIDELKKLGRYIISNSANEITYSKLSRILGVKHISTISNWISYFEEVFLILKLERFSFKLKQQFIAPKKIYCVDTGLVDSIGFKFSEDRGRIIENAVAIELQRRKTSKLDLEVYYWKDAQQREVDFVLKEKNKIRQLIQVSHTDSRKNIKEREIKALLRACKALRCKDLIIITWDYESEAIINDEKIKFIPLWKWLFSL
ncbi:MAG: ATP-binding protein [Nanoarchaeota archaeon]|nr:ATP-binding protein [Nanoarchaeota archaeon]